MRCRAKNSRKERCGGYAVKGSRYCFTHDPTRGKQRAEARKLGGHNRQTAKTAGDYPGDVDSAGDVLRILNATLLDTWEQENSAQRSRTIGYLLGVALKALEVGELEHRLETLEQIQGDSQS